MTNKKVIQEFFKANLPDKIQKVMDFSSIEPQKDSFINDSLRLQTADLLYSVKIEDEPSYLYLLLEHASIPDKLLPFRLLKYMTAIMDSHLKKTGVPKLPIIYPLVLYTGEKPYRYSTDLFNLFGDEKKDIARDFLTSPYQLIDLTQVPDEVLRKYQWFGTMALLTKHIRDSDILPFLKTLIDVLRALEKQGGESYIYTSISYIAEAGEVSSNDELIRTIKQLESVNEDKFMKIVESFKPEIFARGKAEGREEKSIEIAKNMLAKGIDFETIIAVTGLSEDEVKELPTKH